MATTIQGFCSPGGRLFRQRTIQSLKHSQFFRKLTSFLKKGNLVDVVIETSRNFAFERPKTMKLQVVSARIAEEGKPDNKGIAWTPGTSFEILKFTARFEILNPDVSDENVDTLLGDLLVKIGDEVSHRQRGGELTLTLNAHDLLDVGGRRQILASCLVTETVYK